MATHVTCDRCCKDGVRIIRFTPKDISDCVQVHRLDLAKPPGRSWVSWMASSRLLMGKRLNCPTIDLCGDCWELLYAWMKEWLRSPVETA